MTAFGVRATVRERVRRLGRRSVLFDAGVAALVVAAGIAGVWLLIGPFAEIRAAIGGGDGDSAPAALAYLGAVVLTAPLAIRRLFPVISIALVTAGYVFVTIADTPEYVSGTLALLVSVYSVGAYAPRHAVAARLAHVLVVATIVGWQLWTFDYSTVPWIDEADLALFSLYDRATAVVINVVAYAFAWVLGDTVRRSRRRQAELTERTAELAAANRTIARQAVADERLRIARELHDVVAHHVSVMGLQAGAARRVLGRDPDAATRALGVVEDTSRRAVDELQRLLGMLRGRTTDAGAPAPADDGTPQPTLADLAGLLERMRGTGLDVRVRTRGTQPEVPAGVELAVYRVVQEALTNVLKHAGSTAHVDVELDYASDRLRIAVRSRPAAGARRARPGGSVGRGLIGMQERVAMHGGELAARALADGGFEVIATIPV